MPRTERRSKHAHTHLSRCVFTALVAVLLFLSLHGSSIAGTVGRDAQPSPSSHAAKEAPLRSSLGTFAIPEGGSPVVSLQAACRSEVALFCGGSPDSPLRCLVEHFYRVKSGAAAVHDATDFSGVCEAWLAARDACLSFVHAQGAALCGEAARDPRECLRRIPAAFLPPTCVASDYYQGVRLVGKLRQHQGTDARVRTLRGQ